MGCSSVVWSAFNKNTKGICAIKTYARVDLIDDDRLRNIQN
jgi:hypothetical protein